MTFAHSLMPVRESMSKENHSNSDNNHFDPCHSEGIQGGCNSCSHRDECIPIPVEDEFVRDPMEPRPDEQLLVVSKGEQLTLFDLNEYLDITEPVWHERFATDTVFTHMEDGTEDEELTLIDFMLSFDCDDDAEFRMLLIDSYVNGYWEPMRFDLDSGDYLLDYCNNSWHLATPQKWKQLTNEYSHENCDWATYDESYVHLEGEGKVQRFPLKDYFEGFEDFVRIKAIKDAVESVEVLLPMTEPYQVGYIHGTLYVATPEQMATLVETATIVDQFDADADDLGDEW